MGLPIQALASKQPFIFLEHVERINISNKQVITKAIMTAPREDQMANNGVSQRLQEDGSAGPLPAEELMQLGAVPLVNLLLGGLRHDLFGQEELHQPNQNLMDPMQLLTALEDILAELPEEDF